jgi:hypothetical protein
LHGDRPDCTVGSSRPGAAFLARRCNPPTCLRACSQRIDRDGKSLLSYTMKPAVNLEGDYGKSRECASAASCGAATGTVATGEIRSSNFGHRVVKRFRNIP